MFAQPPVEVGFARDFGINESIVFVEASLTMIQLIEIGSFHLRRIDKPLFRAFTGIQ